MGDASFRPQGEEVLRPGSRFGPNDDQHELGEELGSGAAARVYRCRRLKTGETLAAKVINLQRLKLLGDLDAQMSKLNREVEILRELTHPRIVNLCTVHKTKNWIFLVMELVDGGELFDQIVQNRTLKEIEAKYIFRQLLEGVGYMHSKHVIHRDLKPENILVSSTRDASGPETGKLHDVKIADFGLSKVIHEGLSFAKTFVGTPQYWAPEVLNVQAGGGTYTQAADFWSLGIVLFVMICGRYPFDGKKMPLEEQIRTATFSFGAVVWQKVSDEAKDIVCGLLRVKPSERMGLQDCLSHPWLTGGKCTVVEGSGAITAAQQQLLPSPCGGPLVTEVSRGSAGSAGGSAVPVVTQASNTSDLSGQSASIDGASVSQEQHATGGSAASSKRQNVPSIQVGLPTAALPGGSLGGAAEQDTFDAGESIFCLNELLKLQVSIAGSLEMACLAFRHADMELSDAIRKTFRQARDLSSHAVNVVSHYAQVAQQVSQFVLPDLKLSVQEKEPSLAISLLGMVKSWVANMKSDGEEIQRRYMVLQESIHILIQRAQHTKTDADRRLAEAVQVSESELAAVQFLALSPHSGGGGAGGFSSAPCGSDGYPSGASGGSGATPGVAASSKDPGMDTSNALSVRFSMNVWTRQLFEQLSKAQEGSGSGGAAAVGEKLGTDMQMLANGEAGHTSSPGDSGTGRAEAEDEAWKREVLELLFMAPGIAPSQLPKVETLKFTAEDHSPTFAKARCTSDTSTAGTGGGDVPMAGEETDIGAGGKSGPGGKGGPEDALVRYTPGGSAAQSAAEAVTHSSASLLRALRELKRVDEILQGCSAFWANMDGTVQKLAQMKEHTECLVNFASSSKPLRERFEQRLGEYTTFWSSLDGLCRQYCLDHQAASKRMYEVIREVADAADVIDTAQSARLGMVLAMREKQRRHGYS